MTDLPSIMHSIYWKKSLHNHRRYHSYISQFFYPSLSFSPLPSLHRLPPSKQSPCYTLALTVIKWHKGMFDFPFAFLSLLFFPLFCLFSPQILPVFEYKWKSETVNMFRCQWLSSRVVSLSVKINPPADSLPVLCSKSSTCYEWICAKLAMITMEHDKFYSAAKSSHEEFHTTFYHENVGRGPE